MQGRVPLVVSRVDVGTPAKCQLGQSLQPVLASHRKQRISKLVFYVDWNALVQQLCDLLRAIVAHGLENSFHIPLVHGRIVSVSVGLKTCAWPIAFATCIIVRRIGILPAALPISNRATTRYTCGIGTNASGTTMPGYYSGCATTISTRHAIHHAGVRRGSRGFLTSPSAI
jgi:hypothetical protein